MSLVCIACFKCRTHSALPLNGSTSTETVEVDLSRASNLVAKSLEVCHIPRKEVIHEQLPLPMPCYDLLLITDLTVVPGNRGLRVLSALLS